MWVLLLFFVTSVHQIEFETAGLCDRAKAQLIAENAAARRQLACVQVRKEATP